MATQNQFSVDANTLALYHMDGAIASAGKLDNAEGTSARDLTEHGTQTASTGQIIPTSNGAYTDSLASGNYLTASTGLGTGVFTIEAWIKSTDTAGQSIWISSYSAGNYFVIGQNLSGGSNKLYVEGNFSDSKGGSTTFQGYCSTTINDGNWHYIAVVYDQSGTASMKVYVDGNAETITTTVGANTHTGTLSSNPSVGFFAHATGGSSFNATPSMDEVRFSNVARTSTEIYDYYNQLDVTVSGTVQSATFSIPAYSTKVDVTPTPAVQSAVFSIPAYTIFTPDVVVFSSVVSATFSIPAYTPITDVAFDVGVQSATFSTPDPMVMIGQIVTPPVQAMTFSIPTYAIAISTIETPSAQAMTFSIPAYSEIISVALSVSVLVASFTIPDPPIRGRIWGEKFNSGASDPSWSDKF